MTRLNPETLAPFLRQPLDPRGIFNDRRRSSNAPRPRNDLEELHPRNRRLRPAASGQSRGCNLGCTDHLWTQPVGVECRIDALTRIGIGSGRRGSNSRPQAWEAFKPAVCGERLGSQNRANPALEAGAKAKRVACGSVEFSGAQTIYGHGATA